MDSNEKQNTVGIDVKDIISRLKEEKLLPSRDEMIDIGCNGGNYLSTPDGKKAVSGSVGLNQHDAEQKTDLKEKVRSVDIYAKATGTVIGGAAGATLSGISPLFTTMAVSVGGAAGVNAGVIVANAITKEDRNTISRYEDLNAKNLKLAYREACLNTINSQPVGVVSSYGVEIKR